MQPVFTGRRFFVFTTVGYICFPPIGGLGSDCLFPLSPTARILLKFGLSNFRIPEVQGFVKALGEGLRILKSFFQRMLEATDQSPA